MSEQLKNVNISDQRRLLTPEQIKQDLPADDSVAQTVLTGRHTIEAILDRKDPRLLVVLGPCSIHDEQGALDYAARLAPLARQVDQTMLLVMRVYFEKPRTSVGWKGFINDPDLDDSFKVDEGLSRARKLLLEINRQGLPVGTEALDPISPQFLDDLIAWYAIGARTAESQTHREMASGLSSPVGFKNGTNGNVDVAVNALKTVSTPHHFLGIDKKGHCCVFSTRGNHYAHTVLRGGAEPNYDSVSIALCEKTHTDAGLIPNIMVDCSHANSKKNYELQPLVFQDCIHQILEGNHSIIGMMVESNLQEGNQSFTGDKTQLEYGKSITDACIGWEQTEELLLQAHEKLTEVLPGRLEK